MKAIWRGRLIADNDDTIMVQRNHYFPPSALTWSCRVRSDRHTVCSWNGRADYYHVIVDGELSENAAWCYLEPKRAAERIHDHVAFAPEIEVVD